VKGQRIAPAKRERALELRRNMAPAEKKLWQALRGKRVAGVRFRRQQTIDGFIADFYCPTAALVVEVDGSAHADQSDYDQERDRILAQRGLSVLRFTNSQVMDALEFVVGAIAAVCRGRSKDPLVEMPSR
jgi:very-short-patch-repair endonuclease